MKMSTTRKGTVAVPVPISSSSSSSAASTESSSSFVHFEISGKVQGVYFRKFTNAKAHELKLSGWVRNTDKGTVEGEAEGPTRAIILFKRWLKNTGSPKSRIDAAIFTEEQTITEKRFTSFEIRD